MNAITAYILSEIVPGLTDLNKINTNDHHLTEIIRLEPMEAKHIMENVFKIEKPGISTRLLWELLGSNQ